GKRSLACSADRGLEGTGRDEHHDRGWRRERSEKDQSGEPLDTTCRMGCCNRRRICFMRDGNGESDANDSAPTYRRVVGDYEVWGKQPYCDRALISASIIGRRPDKKFEDLIQSHTLVKCLYVDDGAFPFNSENKTRLAIGCEDIYDHFARFGLEMHIGRTVNGKETASKTECVHSSRTTFGTTSISTDLRIKKAGQAMGAPKHFFNNEHVDTYTKHLIFKAIPLNLLLWGCETWSLREDHYVKLESFLPSAKYTEHTQHRTTIACSAPTVLLGKAVRNAILQTFLLPDSHDHSLLQSQAIFRTASIAQQGHSCQQLTVDVRENRTRNANSQLDQTGEAGIAAIEVRIVSLTHLAKDGSNPAHGKEEQADDHHPELAEKKNLLPADNGTQKVSEGTSLIHSECSDLDLTQLKWTPWEEGPKFHPYHSRGRRNPVPPPTASIDLPTTPPVHTATWRQFSGVPTADLK
ncbi:hypothetical protein THAOC_11175, partial [Thalassiosira oceanica]